MMHTVENAVSVKNDQLWFKSQDSFASQPQRLSQVAKMNIKFESTQFGHSVIF